MRPHSFNSRSAFPNVPAREHHPVRHVPISLVEHLRHDGLLPLDAKRIDRVQQVDSQPLGKLPHQRQNLIEVRLHLDRLCAVFERLRQLAECDVAVRDENDGLQSRRACIRRH